MPAACLSSGLLTLISFCANSCLVEHTAWLAQYSCLKNATCADVVGLLELGMNMRQQHEVVTSMQLFVQYVPAAFGMLVVLERL